MKKPSARHDFSPDKFPITIRIYSGETGEVVWSRTVTLEEARSLAAIEIPGFAETEHWPVRVDMIYADSSIGSADIIGGITKDERN